ncbi:hypothetical protein [Actinocorallia longicatena]|uniref:SWIM-type domain-containing protein n=1 Tax=Actinocorallia longicatena TaxID=111803 RepID=A0ABP6QR52_9ACTN
MTTALGFPAFPPQRAGKSFAATWWGRAWVEALEETVLDRTLTQAGRAYAKRGLLGPLGLSPGRIAAAAEDHHAVVKVPTLSDAEWVAFADAVTARAGNLAALLSGDLPRDILEEVPILPWTLDFECDCGGWECRHALGLAYQVAWLLDEDPFLLLLLRGRDRAAVLAAPPAGEPARSVFARTPGPLPERLPPVPPPTGLDGAALAAARTARELLGWDSVGGGR